MLRVVITRRQGRLRLGLVLIGLCLAALIAYLGIVVELEHIIDKRVGLVEIVDEVIVGLVLWEALRGLRAAATSRAVAVAVAAGPGGSPGTAAFTATASSATCSAATYPASRSVPLLLLEPLDLLASKLLRAARDERVRGLKARPVRAVTINNVFEVLFKPTRSRAAHAHSYTSGSALNQRAQPQRSGDGEARPAAWRCPGSTAEHVARSRCSSSSRCKACTHSER